MPAKTACNELVETMIKAGRFLAGARNDSGRRSSPRTLIRGPSAEPSLARLEQDFVKHRFQAQGGELETDELGYGGLVGAALEV